MSCFNCPPDLKATASLPVYEEIAGWKIGWDFPGVDRLNLRSRTLLSSWLVNLPLTYPPLK